MRNELRPCPFCGGEAEVLLPFYCGVVARCKRCGVELREYVISPTHSLFEEAEHKVIEQWNRRSYDAEISDLKSGIFRNPEKAFVMGFPMLKVVLLADALIKKGVSFEQVDDFVANVGNAYEYAFNEQERTVREVLAPFGKFEFTSNGERWSEWINKEIKEDE